jgi:hypothetical protein
VVTILDGSVSAPLGGSAATQRWLQSALATVFAFGYGQCLRRHAGAISGSVRALAMRKRERAGGRRLKFTLRRFAVLFLKALGLVPDTAAALLDVVEIGGSVSSARFHANDSARFNPAVADSASACGCIFLSMLVITLSSRADLGVHQAWQRVVTVRV